MSTAIVWFRRDLRLADNPALNAAVGSYDTVVPVYIHAPEEDGAWPPGGAQRWWLHHSLTALEADLAQLGAQLIVRNEPSREALADLVAETDASAVLWNRVYEPAHIDRDRAIKQTLRDEHGVRTESFNARLLFEPWQVQTGHGGPYRVYTPFWRAIWRQGLPNDTLAAPRAVPGPKQRLASDSIAALDLLPRIPWDAGLAATWRPGEAGAQAALDAFLAEPLADYDDGRERPSEPGTSSLSPHLHFGEIGPRQIVRALLDAGYGDSADGQRFLGELGWREFAHHLLYHFPATPCEPLNAKFTGFPWRDTRGEAAGDLVAWQSGHTGIPMVDAGMRELWSCGWMHNRVRMVVASLLTKNLRIHWLEGARWFWDTLVDADLANNTLGWQWVAGCGADAAPYFRIFNPVRQGERFDPDGEYVRRWNPALGRLPTRHVHAPWQAPREVLQEAGVRLGENYPEPIVDLQHSRQQALDAFARLGDK